MIATLNAVTAGGGLSLEEYVHLAARHGFKGVDIGIGEVQKIGVEAARELFDSNGVVPASFGLPTEWRKDDATFQTDLSQLKDAAQTAQQLGVTRCVTWVLPSTDEPVSEYSSRSQQRLIQCAQVLNEHGIKLGLEFLGPKHFRTNPDNVWFYDIPGALQVVDEMNREGGVNNVGLLVDCWHWYTGGGTVMDLASIPVEQIVHVHVNDAPDIEVDDQIDNVRLLPGQSGVIDIRGFLNTLAALGYDGPVAVETFSDELKTITPDEAAARAGAAMRHVFDEAELEF